MLLNSFSIRNESYNELDAQSLHYLVLMPLYVRAVTLYIKLEKNFSKKYLVQHKWRKVLLTGYIKICNSNNWMRFKFIKEYKY